MPGRLEGKVAFITGAGRGQGRAHAVRLAEEGADVIVTDAPAQVEHMNYPTASAGELAETVRQVESLGRRIVAGAIDVRDLAGMKAFVSDAVARLGRLDVIIANAGIDITGPWHAQTPEIWQTTLDVNLTGVYNTVLAGVDGLLAAGGGSIIMTSSANGLKAGPFNMAYNVSKFGVVAPAKSLAMELAKDGIRVNTVHPGSVDTPMGVGARDGFEPGREENPNLYGMITKWMPGLIDPSEISNLMVYLASDESKWATGGAFVVDGGLSSY
mgnify:FL=1